MSGEVARTVQQMMLAVVQEGTSTKADLATFDVAGKSGTARRTSVNEGYVRGSYTASFVGLFPGTDPQYVVLVKIDNPRGGHYGGGDIAAPVTKIVLRAALAARDAALNRDDLAASEKIVPTKNAASSTGGAHDEPVSSELAERVEKPNRDSYDPNRNVRARDAEEGSAPFVVDLPAKPKSAPVAIAPRPVPDVRGLSVRQAVRALHAAGFRVRLQSSASTGTLPAAGTIAAPGSLVQLSIPLE
jgi:cell division protein FtsI (penicillin-binding protein 3)